VDVSPSDSGIIKVNQVAKSFYPATFTFSNSEAISLEAVPASGYEFDNWSGDIMDTTNPTTVIMDCNKKVTASFSPIIRILTMKFAGNGSTAPKAGTHAYNNGAVVAITATPDAGWRFGEWNGDVSEPKLPTTTVIMNADKIVTANFSQIMHTLGISVIGEGYTTPAIGNHTYPLGTRVSITAVPGDGWQFNGWAGNISESDLATITIIMDSDKIVTANFSQTRSNWWLVGGIVFSFIVLSIIAWVIAKSRIS